MAQLGQETAAQNWRERRPGRGGKTRPGGSGGLAGLWLRAQAATWAWAAHLAHARSVAHAQTPCSRPIQADGQDLPCTVAGSIKS
jgi:hypothetical protein